MSRLNNAPPAVSVRAEHVSDHLSVFVVAEDTDDSRPANGGLRLLNYPSDEACIADGQRLAGLMTHKHDLYGTGFAGGKIVARADDPSADKAELISITARPGVARWNDDHRCDLNTSLEDMESSSHAPCIGCGGQQRGCQCRNSPWNPWRSRGCARSN